MRSTELEPCDNKLVQERNIIQRIIREDRDILEALATYDTKKLTDKDLALD